MGGWSTAAVGWILFGKSVVNGRPGPQEEDAACVLVLKGAMARWRVQGSQVMVHR